MDAGALRGNIEALSGKIATLKTKTDSEKLAYAETCLRALARAAERRGPIFGVEPWHPLGGSHVSPGEYLLRLKDAKGEALPPYPFIMFFYENNLTAEIDTILFLCALWQFSQDSEKQVSVNVSARTLNDGGFVRAAMSGLEQLGLKPGGAERIIFEIHESTGNVKMNKPVLAAFRKIGAGFAIDDAGLSLDHVFRLSEFDEIADYVKIDRKAVCAQPEEAHSLSRVMDFIRSLLPGTIAVAEGVQSAAHAAEIYQAFPDILYAQGLYLPGREAFSKEYETLRMGKAGVARK